MHISYKTYKFSHDKSEIKRIYEESFPKNEKFPFWVLRYCSDNPNIHLDCILVDDKPVGMQFIVKETGDISYLMYLAIDEKYQNRGYGSQTVKNLVMRNDNVLLSIERPVDSNTRKRKEFYLKNGLYETGCFIEDTGVQYELLSSVKGYIPDIEVLKNRYAQMSENPIIKFIIKHIFCDEIKFVD